MDESGIDEDALLGEVEQVVEVGEVTEATANAVAGAVLVQHEHLTGTEPAERAVVVVEAVGQRLRLQQSEELVVRIAARVGTDVLVHAVLACPVSICN